MRHCGYSLGDGPWPWERTLPLSKSCAGFGRKKPTFATPLATAAKRKIIPSGFELSHETRENNNQAANGLHFQTQNEIKNTLT